MNTMFEFELIDYVNGFINGGIVGGAIVAGVYSYHIKKHSRTKTVDPILERSKKQLLDYAQKNPINTGESDK